MSVHRLCGPVDGHGAGPADPPAFSSPGERPGPAPTIYVPLTEAQIRAVVECIERDLVRCQMDDCDTCDEAADASIEMQLRLGLQLTGRNPNPKVPRPSIAESRSDFLAVVSDGLKRALGLTS